MSFTFVIDDDLFENVTFTIDVDPRTQPCHLRPLPRTAGLVLCPLLIAIVLLAVPGNLLVGWVISKSKQVLTPSDVYLLHLTIADGLMALTLPFFAATLVRGWIFGDFLCKFLNLVIEANFYTSIFFLACISVDRYLVIVRARETLQRRHRSCSRVLCAAVWGCGWALALPALFREAKAVKLGDEPEFWVCAENFEVGSATAWRLATRGFLHVVGFVVPLTVMVVCYGVTIVRLLHTRGFQKHRAMRVILAVVIAFVLCWTPYHVTLLVDTLLRASLIAFDCGTRGAVNVALVYTNCVALLHSCVNPFLYAFVGRKFRNKMKHLLQRRFRSEGLSGARASRSTSQTSEGTGTVL